MLTLQDNRFKDNSTNNFTITSNGDTKIEAFSPFNPTAAYSASTHGGSGYFDDSGDTLRIASNSAFDIGTGDFTLECWVYMTSTSGVQGVAGNHNDLLTGGFGIFVLNGTPNVQLFTPGSSSSDNTTSGNISAYTWNHLAAVRSGGTLRMYTNGISGAGVASARNPNNTDFFDIGTYEDSAFPAFDYRFPGYISNLRLVKGTAVYTSNFTPPTAPLTAITNTSLLLNFTNGGIIDNASKNVLETVGNAQISTSVKKFGTGSMYFDGTGDFLAVLDNSTLRLESGPFTIEAWIYPAVLADKAIISKGVAGTSGWVFGTDGTGKLRLVYDANLNISSTATLSLNTWSHVAVVREGTGSNQVKLYINGVNDGTGTVSSNFNQTSVLRVGSDRNNNSSSHWNGYIDDLRITKGVARYTANFTPPTAAFPDL